MIYLSIDFGTSSVKMSLVDDNVKTLCSAKGDYSYIILPGEKNELSPDSLWKAFYTAASKLDQDLLSKIDMICYDTFSPSPVFMDKNGDLVYDNIITHMDRRSRPQTDYIDQVIGKDNYMNIAGIYPFAGGCSAMTLIWFKQNMPEVLDKTYRIGHLPSYVHKKLTGEWMVDLVNASMLGMYETTTQGTWSKTLIDTFGMKAEWFSEIKNPGTILGGLLPEIAEKLGCKAGIPVAVGTNDVAVAHMGAKNFKAGEMMDTAGSSEMISILTDVPKVNPHYYLRNAVLPGLWQIYATTCGGFEVQWFKEQFCREMSDSEYFGHYIVDCIEKYLDHQDVIFDPYMTGDRQSLEKKTAAIRNLSLASTRDEIMAAMLRSMQSVMTDTMKEAQKAITLSKQIKISGGMISDAYLKLKSLEIPGYEFVVVDDCCVKGNVELVKYYMK